MFSFVKIIYFKYCHGFRPPFIKFFVEYSLALKLDDKIITVFGICQVLFQKSANLYDISHKASYEIDNPQNTCYNGLKYPFHCSVYSRDITNVRMR